MAPSIDDLAHQLDHGLMHWFSDWPTTDVPVGPSGVYAIWHGPALLYVGMSYAHRGELVNQRAKGVHGRLASHASGRRSGDQFCVYICDRFVIPQLTPVDMDALARGERILDQRTKTFIHDHLSYRVVATADGAQARALETQLRRDGLASVGRPLINP